jgi:hypothetical protein
VLGISLVTSESSLSENTFLLPFDLDTNLAVPQILV